MDKVMTQEVLDTRESTHGSFRERAAICNNLRSAIFSNLSTGLEPDQVQSLIMIADKISRIVSGNADEPDHWIDIAGYAQLITNRLMEGLDDVGQPKPSPEKAE